MLIEFVINIILAGLVSNIQTSDYQINTAYAIELNVKPEVFNDKSINEADFSSDNSNIEEQNQSFVNSLPKNKKIIQPVKIKKEYDSLGVEISAKSALVVDIASGAVLFAKNEKESRSIASITKLMTALVLIDLNLDENKQVEMLADYKVKEGVNSDILIGDVLLIKDYFKIALIGSMNDVVNLLVANSGISRDHFINLMNEKARILGLIGATFADPTGLEAKNQATATDIAKIISNTLKNENLKSILQQKTFSIKTIKYQKEITDKSTNYDLLTSFLNIGAYRILIGKTGYIDEAGYCLGTAIKNGQGNEIIVVVLGSASLDSRTQEIKSLASWSFENYQW